MSDEDDDCHKPICKDNPFGKMRSTLSGLKKVEDECPLDRPTLGFFSWSLIHTFAVHYPEHPTEEHKKAILGWLEGFKELYPCTHCRVHFKRDYLRGGC